MRKMKKINGYLVIRFNDREKQGYPQIGSFGVIDAEFYTGHIDIDLSAFEYDDADTMEVAVEQARGLEAEQDFSDEEPFYTIVTESAEEVKEKEVEPALLVNGMKAKLQTQIKSKGFPYITPTTAAHELVGYKTALYDLGLLGEDDAVTDLHHFGELCEFQDDDGHHINVSLLSSGVMARLSPHDFEEGETYTGCTVQTLKCRRCGMESFAWSKEPAPGQEETLAYICDEVCKHREGRTQEELDAICAECKVDRWAGAPPTLTPREVKNLRDLFRLAGEVSEYVNGGEDAPPERSVRRLEVKLPDHITPEAIQKALNAAYNGEPSRETFQNAPSGLRKDYDTKKVYTLGLALAKECPDNDCRVYLNIFNMARELDAALDIFKGDTALALALRSALMERMGDLREMYRKNYAVQQYKEGMKK